MYQKNGLCLAVDRRNAPGGPASRRQPDEGYPGRDPADRMIVATAILAGCDLITMDRDMIAWNGPLRVIDARA